MLTDIGKEGAGKPCSWCTADKATAMKAVFVEPLVLWEVSICFFKPALCPVFVMNRVRCSRSACALCLLAVTLTPDRQLCVPGEMWHQEQSDTRRQRAHSGSNYFTHTHTPLWLLLTAFQEYAVNKSLFNSLHSRSGTENYSKFNVKLKTILQEKPQKNIKQVWVKDGKGNMDWKRQKQTQWLSECRWRGEGGREG